MNYVDLHVHSEYTSGNGITKISELVNKAKEYGMEAIALTDSGTIKGFNEFAVECGRKGIKPIFGCGFYIAPLGLDNPETHHLVLLVKNEEGYSNLLKLNDFSLNEGSGSKPRIDFDVLKRFSEGLISLTGGLGGVFDKPCLSGNIDLAMVNITRLKDIFKDNLFLELQDNGIPNNMIMLDVLIELSKKLLIAPVVTGGSFYLDRDDADECNKLRVENQNKTLQGNGFYFKSGYEIENIFRMNLEAIKNSIKISRLCNMDFKYYNQSLDESRSN